MIFHKFFLGWRNLFFLPRCIFCRRPLALSAEACVCRECMKGIPFSGNLPICQGCGRPVGEGAVYCYRCEKGYRRYYRKVFSAYLYEDEPKRALVRFKRERYRSYAGTFAAHMGILLRDEMIARGISLVIAVPPRRKRMRETGYDQAAALGRALAKKLGIPYLAAALRQKEVRKKQSTLKYRERYQNVLGNYVVLKKQEVAGKRILLVDDICTTGSTLNECSRMLKDAGALEVYCAVAAISYEENIFQI